MQDLSGDLARMRRRKEQLEREVANLANIVAQGDFSSTLRAALVDREREISQITDKLIGAESDAIQARLRNVRSYVLAEMRNVREVLNSDVTHMRAQLANHIEESILKPSGETYTAAGTWNFLGCGTFFIGSDRTTRVPAESCRGRVSSLPISGPQSAFAASLSTKAQYETRGTV